jgi:hypothetical protein
MYKELESLIALISSWEEDNLKLAETILKANPQMLNDLEAYFKPLTQYIRAWEIGNWLNLDEFSHYIAYGFEFQTDSPDLEEFAFFFHQMKIFELDLSYMGLKKIPAWVLEIRQLRILELGDNEITILPPEIGQLSKLEELNIENNQLTALPQEICQLSQLERLVLDHNHIQKLPENIGNLKALEWLCLEDNEIEVLPKSSMQLKNLEWLSVEGTPLGKKYQLDDGVFITVEDQDFRNFIA